MLLASPVKGRAGRAEVGHHVALRSVAAQLDTLLHCLHVWLVQHQVVLVRLARLARLAASLGGEGGAGPGRGWAQQEDGQQ